MLKRHENKPGLKVRATMGAPKKGKITSEFFSMAGHGPNEFPILWENGEKEYVAFQFLTRDQA